MRGVSDKIRRILSQHNIKTVFKPNLSIKDQLTKVKKTDEGKDNLIYKVGCSDCDRFYIGESMKKLSTRINEHKRDTKSVNFSSSISEHTHTNNNNHRSDFDAVTLEREKHTLKRKVKESIFIYSNGERVNNAIMLNGVGIHDIWKPLISHFSNQFVLS